MSDQAPTASTAADATLAAVLSHLSKSMQDMNVALTLVSQKVIAQKDQPVLNISPILVDLQDIVAKVATCQTALLRAKEAWNVPDLPAVTEAPVDQPAARVRPSPVETPVNPEPITYTNYVEGAKLKQTFHSIFIDKMTPQVLFGGRGRLDPTTTILGKFAESLVDYLPDQISDWPDGWYSAANPDVVELLLTLEPVKDADPFKPQTGVGRIHVFFRKTLRAMDPKDLLWYRFSDSTRWLSEEYYTESILKMIKFNLMMQLSTMPSLRAVQTA